jgi:polysaccharide deacetylase 2 family uncharacterized protein YibQ
LTLTTINCIRHEILSYKKPSSEGISMAEDIKLMDRRNFLVKMGYSLIGSLLGLNYFSNAHAFQQIKVDPFFRSQIALIIDDIGFSLPRARKFLELEAPITFAILPRLAYSRDLAGEIYAQGHEIMLHQPMEPFDANIDPGPGALYVGDRANRIIRIMEENISDIPFAIGVNNHMGSRFTSCQKEMKKALRVIKERDLFFIDSLTSSHSLGYETAKRLDVTTAYRNIFLDNLPTESAILFQLCKLQKHAMKYGYAIGIGHPYPETAKTIGRFLKRLDPAAVSLVHISKILHT